MPKPKPSLHSLHTVRASVRTALLSPAPITPHTPSYGVLVTRTPTTPNTPYRAEYAVQGEELTESEMPISPTVPHMRRPLLNAALKFGVIFLFGSAVLALTIYFGLPPLDPADRPLLHIPKSFDDLKGLNTLLQKQKNLYPFRTVLCFVVAYLFDQAFSLPGSMYLSILAGAVWGFWISLPLCCACTATGASLCYLLSAALGPALLALPKWAARVDRWRTKLDSQRSNLFSFLLILRIAPLPPHWVTNVVCPHLGVPLPFFWLTAFLGILPPTVIHVTIGGGLDQMTSAGDFHLLSLRNVGGLVGVALALLVPVAIRTRWKGEIEQVQEVDEEAEDEADVAENDERTGLVSDLESEGAPDSPSRDDFPPPPPTPPSPLELDADGGPPKEDELLVLLKNGDSEAEAEAEAGKTDLPHDGEGSRWWGWWKGRGVRLG